MNCNCIEALKEKLATHYSDKLGAEARANCENMTMLLVGNRMRSALTTSFRITAQAKGFIKGKIIPVTGSYCPFCGKAVVTKPVEPATEAA